MPCTSQALAIGATVLMLAACSSSPSTTTSAPPSSTTVATTAPTTTAPTTTAPSTPSTPTTAQAVAKTSIDPCQLVTSSEASTLAGATFGAGKEETYSGGGGKGCVYGAQTLNVFTVEVAQASDPAAAQAEWNTEQGRAETALKQGIPGGLHVALNTAPLTGLGDRAATVSASAKIAGQTVAISGIYVLKGAVFFAFQDLVLGHQAPAASALEAQAQTDLGRLP
jgi:hypothetical protein